MANLTNNMNSLQNLFDKVNALPNATDYLDEINVINGGASASTINDAIDNTEGHANTQEILIG